MISYPAEATENEKNIKWKLLGKIYDKDFGFTDLEEKTDNIRFSVRVLLYNERG